MTVETLYIMIKGNENVVLEVQRKIENVIETENIRKTEESLTMKMMSQKFNMQLKYIKIIQGIFCGISAIIVHFLTSPILYNLATT